MAGSKEKVFFPKSRVTFYRRKIIGKNLLISIKESKNKREIINDCRDLFEDYFPKYTWKDLEFNITYTKDDYKIIISKIKKNRNIEIKICEEILDIQRQLKSDFRKFKRNREKNRKEHSGSYHELMTFYYFQEECITLNPKLNDLFATSIFIPASRSFFASLQKNIFSFLAQNIEIDTFVKDFGSSYESAKNLYNEFGISKNKSSISKKISEIMNKILNGNYEYKDEKDWINSNYGKINLSNASSGQQEALPMLLIFYIYSFRRVNNLTFYIEEPEAHLFPTSQKHITQIIALLYNNGADNFITTHSPYILTALNNLILAYDIKEKKGSKAIDSIVDEEMCINFDELEAYTIENGVLISIKDKEERLIGINIIDSVSDDFSNDFDKLLSISMKDD